MMKYIKKLPFVLVYITIIYLSLKTPSGNPSLFNNIDKLYHFIAYGSLGFAVCLTTFNKKIVYILLTISIALGLTLEYLQGLLPYRDMSIADGIANVLGLFSGVLSYKIITNIVKFRRAK